MPDFTAIFPSLRRWLASRHGQITLGASALVLVVCAVPVFGSGPAVKGPPRFQHCPSCSHEEPYSDVFASRLCPDCKQGPLVATTESTRASAGLMPTTPSGRWLLFGFVALLVVQADLYLWITFTRTAPPPEDDEDWYKSRCPRCRRKLGYPASKAGLNARCPGCKLEFVLPGV